MDEEPNTVRARTRTATNTRDNQTPPVNQSRRTTWIKDPPVQIRITYESGREDILTREEIDGDNPILKRLINIRTVRRFWRLNSATVSDPVYYTDEEVLLKATHEGLKTTDPVEAGKAMNYVAKFYLTGPDGEPLERDGKWVEAAPSDLGAYRPAGSSASEDATPPPT
jgi:hypothetical protein